jgi:GTP-binding protein
MVDGVLLLVDAFDGPMPQTKFVLKKSLELHLKPIVVINKVDRPNCRPDEVASLTFDLFCELNATDEQLDFPIVYASGKQGWAALDLDDPRTDMKALLETIVHRVLPPIADAENPFQMLVTMLDYDSYMGRIGSGRIYHGTVKLNDPVVLIKRDGTQTRNKVTRILRYVGLKRAEVQSAIAGDIISIAGIEEVHVGETLASPERPEALPLIKVDEPTIAMFFSHSTSPLSGGRRWTLPHLAPYPRAPRARGHDQRGHSRRGRGRRRALQGERARRAPPRDPHRDHAPRGLRDGSLAAACDLEGSRRSPARTDGGSGGRG